MYTLIEHRKLDTAAASITFSNIPQTYTDLVLVYALRTDRSATDDSVLIRFNSATTNFTVRELRGTGSGVNSNTFSVGFCGFVNGASSTSSTFSSQSIYIPNYANGNNKSFSVDGVFENNATSALQGILAGLWSQTSAITSITLVPDVGPNFVQYSSATLYGINRTTAIGKPKAIGGNITYANGYWVHTFTGSGTFSAQENLQVEALVVAGGGGGGGAIGNGGGGGAGGAIVASATIAKGSAVPVTVGAGGPGMLPLQVATYGNGQSSNFLTASAIGGGGGGGYNNNFANAPRGANGGSGGGAWSWSSQGGVAGLGTAGQGNNGGLPTERPGDYAEIAGGGGGATQSGSAGSSATSGSGGNGLLWNGSYYAGGGGGGKPLSGAAAGAGGIGGGGAGGNNSSPNGTAGTANTGGGGGGNSYTSTALNTQVPGSGGSGVVVIRYRAD